MRTPQTRCPGSVLPARNERLPRVCSEQRAITVVSVLPRWPGPPISKQPAPLGRQPLPGES